MVLVVDDDDVARYLVRSYLADRGVAVVEVAGGAGALVVLLGSR